MTDRRSASRRELLAGLGIAGMAALAGCSARPVTPSGGDLRIGTLRPPITLDPVVARDVGSAQMIGKIFVGLYTYDESLDLMPQIASGEPKTENGGRRYTVDIREDAKFQNGKDVLAEDVKYSFEAPVEEETPSRWHFDMIESVETPDDRTVRFTLKFPYPAFDHSLTQSIVPKSARESGKEQFSRNPVGAGPFELRHFSEDKKTKVVRWPEYWGDPKPAVGKVTAVGQESPLTRAMSLVTGRNRIIEPVSPRVSGLIDKRNGATVRTKRGFSTYHIGFNLNEGPTTDPTVRKAIDYCIDVDEAVDDFVAPIGEREYSPLPERMAKRWNMPLEAWRDIPVGKNAEKAKLLFEEAHLEKEIQILVPKDPKRMEIGRRLATGIRDAGKRASVSPAPWKKFLEKRVSGVPSDYMVVVDGIHGGPDPDLFTYQTFHEDQEGLTNGLFYDNDDVMKKLDTARRTSNRQRRRQLYSDAITTILRDRVVLPGYSYRNSFGVKNTVRNFRVHPSDELNPRVSGPDGVVRIDDTDFLGGDGGGSR